MDIISTALYSVRVGSVNARTIRRSGQWGMRFPAVAGIGFHLIKRGTGWLISATQAPATVTPGDFILSSSGAAHGLSHTPCELADLPLAPMSAEDAGPEHADFEFLCGGYRLAHGRVHHYLEALPDVIAMSPAYDRHPELRSLADLFNDDVSDEKPGTDVRRRALMDLMLAHTLLLWDEQKRTPEWPALTDPAINAALRKIHGDPRRRWTVQELSDSAGLTRTAFSRRFASSVGAAPTAYMVSQRLAHGARLLRETTAPLAAISRQVGYSTEFAFSAAFRREYGISPGLFRQGSAASV